MRIVMQYGCDGFFTKKVFCALYCQWSSVCCCVHAKYTDSPFFALLRVILRINILNVLQRQDSFVQRINISTLSSTEKTIASHFFTLAAPPPSTLYFLFREKRDEIKINCNCETMNMCICGICLYIYKYSLYTTTVSVCAPVEILNETVHHFFNDENYFCVLRTTITME